MPETQSLLGALQFADSFFPSGSIAFSWGLETLRTDGEVVSAEQVAQFLEGQLVHRWSTFDVPLLVAASLLLAQVPHLARREVPAVMAVRTACGHSTETLKFSRLARLC